MVFRAILSFSSSAVRSSISFDRTEGSEGIEGEFKWWVFTIPCVGVAGRVLGLMLVNLNLEKRESEDDGEVDEFEFVGGLVRCQPISID